MNRTLSPRHLQKAPPYGAFALNRHKNIFLIAAAVLILCGAIFVGGVAADQGPFPDDGKLTSQTYTLTSNVTLTTNLTVPNGVTCTIDLAGHVLKGNGNGSVIEIESGGNLTVKDGSTATHYFQVSDGSALKTPWVYTSIPAGKTRPDDATDENTIALSDIKSYDGEDGGWAYKNGANYKYKYVTVTGGCITGGTGTSDSTTSHGGGVYVKGTFTLESGNIIGNKVTGATNNRGGGVCVNGTGCEFIMSGGSIAGNYSASWGGGVFPYDGTFTMHNGNIIGNTAANGAGGGVRNGPKTFTMYDGNIIGNTSTNGGGGVYSPASFTMSGGNIIGNTSSKDGGGVLLGDSVSFNVSGAPVIKDNKKGIGSSAAANNVYLNGVDKLTLTGNFTGEIYINSPAPTQGSGGNQFGIATGTPTGANHFISDTPADGPHYLGTLVDNTLKWDTSATAYIVTFNANGHGTAPASQHVTSGEKATEPTPAPAAPSYTFGGWFKEAACTNEWKFDTDTVTEDITLYAKWTANTYTITYKDQGDAAYSGNNEESLVKTHTYGTATPLVSGTKTGYTFGGWFTDRGCTGDPVTTIGATDYTADFTLYAKWTLKSPTVSGETTTTYGTEVTLTAGVDSGFTPDSYQWYEGDSAISGATSSTYTVPAKTAKGEHTYKVKITDSPSKTAESAAHTVTVSALSVTVTWPETKSFKWDGTAKTIEAAIGNVISGDDVSFTYTDNSKTDAGSYTAKVTGLSGAEKDNYSLPASGLECSWSIVKDKYTVKFDGNKPATASGTVTGVPADITNVDDGAAIQAPGSTPTLTGYTFGGWYKEAACTNKWNFSGETNPDTVTGNTTLYAKWTANKYNITYKDQGDAAYSGNNEDSLVKTHVYDTATTLVAGTKTGYTFGGWFTDRGCTGNPVTTIGATDYTADFTLYAKWTADIPPYTITFNGNGGTVTPSTLAVYYGETVNLSTVTVTPRSGYTHSGWALSPNGPTVYAAGQSVKDLGNITLYAVWTPVEKQHTLTVKVTHGNELVSGAAVTLRQGNIQWGTEKTTGVDGKATFDNVPEGVYTVEASNGDGKTKTKAVTIPVEGNEITINLPTEKVSSKVDVKSDAGTPAVAVEGADTVAEAQEPEEGQSITVTVIVESKTDDGSAPETQKEIDEIKNITPAGSKVEYLGITIEKKTEKAGESPTTESITNTDNVLEFLIPYDFTNKTEINLYRCHKENEELVAKPLIQLSEKPAVPEDGRYWLDRANSLIHLYSKKFSTYSVGYFEGSKRPSHSTPSGSSIWIQEPLPAADEKITSTDVTAAYAGIVFIQATTVELRQIEAVNPAYAELISASLEAAEHDGVPLTNSKGAKVIITTPDEIPGIQKETFAQVIDVESADGSKVTSVPFKVRLSDLAAKNLTTDDVTLYHYLEEYGLWVPLETRLVSTDDGYAYYEAATNRASPFGVLLKKLDVPEVKPVPTQTGKTPVPIMGVLAGLGAAGVVFGLRMRR